MSVYDYKLHMVYNIVTDGYLSLSAIGNCMWVGMEHNPKEFNMNGIDLIVNGFRIYSIVGDSVAEDLLYKALGKDWLFPLMKEFTESGVGNIMVIPAQVNIEVNNETGDGELLRTPLHTKGIFIMDWVCETPDEKVIE